MFSDGRLPVWRGGSGEKLTENCWMQTDRWQRGPPRGFGRVRLTEKVRSKTSLLLLLLSSLLMQSAAIPGISEATFSLRHRNTCVFVSGGHIHTHTHICLHV